MHQSVSEMLRALFVAIVALADDDMDACRGHQTEAKQPHFEVRKLFDIVRGDVWTSTRYQQQPFTYGSPPGRDDFYFVAGKQVSCPGRGAALFALLRRAGIHS
jgi:hypothetical protein